MDTLYLVDVVIRLRPVYHADPPEIRVGPNGFLNPCVLRETRDFGFKFYSRTPCTLQVEFLNKLPNDTVPESNLDKAVVIESVSFFGITDPKFAWAGIYKPRYPEPWYSQQVAQGVVLQPQLSPHTYLGWPGKWTLTFDVPVFTWIHETQNLGWIYG